MKAKWLPISAAVAMALASASASAVDFHGYARASMNLNTDGGSIYCPGTGGSAHPVGRLGAECDTYMEMQLDQEVYNKGGNQFKLSTMFAYGSNEDNWDFQGNDWQGVNTSTSSPWGGDRMAIRQVYVDYTMNSGANLWIGKKFYQRKDIHILDLFYLNNSGYGAGIENVKAGPGALSFAVTKFANDVTVDGGTTGDAWRSAYKADLRYANIPTNADGSMEVAAIVGVPNLSDAQDDADVADDVGVILHAEHTQGGFFGGFNKFAVQYATKGFAMDPLGNHLGNNYAPNTAGKMWRVIDWGVVDLGSSWNLGYSAIYGQLSDAEGAGWIWTDTDQYSIVVRPEYKWNDIMKTSLEIGYSATSRDAVDNGDWSDLTKVTLAQSFNAGTGFWARPSLRFYATYFTGDQMEDYNGKDDKELLLGTQVEAWW